MTYGCEGNLADAEADGDQTAHWSERHGVDLLYVLDDLDNMRSLKQKESSRRYSELGWWVEEVEKLGAVGEGEECSVTWTTKKQRQPRK